MLAASYYKSSGWVLTVTGSISAMSRLLCHKGTDVRNDVIG